MPEDIFKNQKMTISCSGIVGRQEDGSPVATLMFQVKFNVGVLIVLMSVLKKTDHNSSGTLCDSVGIALGKTGIK